MPPVAMCPVISTGRVLCAQPSKPSSLCRPTHHSGARLPQTALPHRALPARATLAPLPRPARAAAPRRARRAPAAPAAAGRGAGALSAPGGKEASFLAHGCALFAALALLKGLAGAAAPADLLARSLGHSVEVPLNTALAGAATGVCWVYAAWYASLRVSARAGAWRWRGPGEGGVLPRLWAQATFPLRPL
jgi:hypothetical protein